MLLFALESITNETQNHKISILNDRQMFITSSVISQYYRHQTFGTPLEPTSKTSRKILQNGTSTTKANNKSSTAAIPNKKPRSTNTMRIRWRTLSLTLPLPAGASCTPRIYPPRTKESFTARTSSPSSTTTPRGASGASVSCPPGKSSRRRSTTAAST